MDDYLNEKIASTINKFLRSAYSKYPPSDAKENKLEKIPNKVILNIEEAKKGLESLKIILEKRLVLYKHLQQLLVNLKKKENFENIDAFIKFYKSEILELKKLYMDMVKEITKESEKLSLLREILDALGIAVNRGNYIELITDYNWIENKGLLSEIGDALEKKDFKKAEKLIKIIDGKI